MDDATFDDELRRRLDLLETPGSGESVLPGLPWLDVCLATLGIAALSVLLLWWGYPA
ncbi:hypothetical protein [Pseudonocardia nigra]|uniref:hypothetical protein n=1 Tax=Pseudonocardia nigra TaxID=1921578 RepID=UPI001C5E56D5|nr:hypothetical protein [Pseudonocardia nigra]